MSFDLLNQVGMMSSLIVRNQLSQRTEVTAGINRDGRHEVRRVLLQCAHTVARMKSYEAQPLRMFFERVKQRRGKKIAIVALARKLLTIAYGVLKTQRTYDPEMLTAKTV